MTSDSALNRRSFLARSAAVAAVPAVAALAGGALAEPASADALPDYAPDTAVRAGPGRQRAGLFRRAGGEEPVLGHRRHLPGGLPDHPGRGGAVRRAPDHRAQPAARHRPDRVRQRRVQQGDPHRLLAPPCRPRRRIVAVRPRRGPGRARRDQAAAGPGQRPGPARAPARRDVRDPPHAARRRGADRPGVARHQPHPGQHLHPLPRPRHAHARRHPPAAAGRRTTAST